MLATLSLAALLAKSAAITPQLPQQVTPAIAQPQIVQQQVVRPQVELALELRPMTEEDRAMFPGRERFDKTEWYESQQKSVQTVIVPEYVEEWGNNGRDVS